MNINSIAMARLITMASRVYPSVRLIVCPSSCASVHDCLTVRLSVRLLAVHLMERHSACPSDYPSIHHPIVHPVKHTRLHSRFLDTKRGEQITESPPLCSAVGISRAGFPPKLFSGYQQLGCRLFVPYIESTPSRMGMFARMTAGTFLWVWCM